MTEARPYNEVYAVEISDHADIEHEAAIDDLLDRVERLRDLRQTISASRGLIRQAQAEIRRLEAVIGNAQAEFNELENAK